MSMISVTYKLGLIIASCGAGNNASLNLNRNYYQMNTLLENANESHCLLTKAAIHELEQKVMDGCPVSSEILEIVRAPAHSREYMGGNGQIHWHHCQGLDKSNKPQKDDPEERQWIEREILRFAVDEHQSRIEINGMYNVRMLARWRHGYDAKLAAEARETRHKQALGLNRKHENKEINPATYEARKAKRLARLAKRKGGDIAKVGFNAFS